MHAQDFIQRLDQGRLGATGLSYDEATRMFDALFGGGLADVELGALLVALRAKGENVDELRAGIDTLEPLLRRVRVDPARPAVSIPSYEGARRTANLVPLLACLLADAGVQVVVHGVDGDPRRTTTVEIMQAMGLGPAVGVDAAEVAIERGDPAFVPVGSLSPRLAALIDLRRRLGVRNVGHVLAMLVNPTGSPACLCIAAYARPESGARQRSYFERTGRPGLVLAATEGEVVASTSRAAPIDWVHDGRCETLVPTTLGTSHDLPVLPSPQDAPATARWIQSVLAGERPVPKPIDLQVGAILQALGVRPRLREAVAV